MIFKVIVLKMEQFVYTLQECLQKRQMLLHDKTAPVGAVSSGSGLGLEP